MQSFKETKFDFSNQGLHEIPENVFKHKNLKTLIFRNNNLTEIPKEILKLKNLRTIDFSGNKIRSLKSKFFELKNLKILNLNNNLIKTLPNQVGNLLNLEILNVAGNQLTKIPDSLTFLKKLRKLNLARNNFQEIPNILFSLKSISHLWLNENEINDLPIIRFKEELPNIKALYLFKKNENNNNELINPLFNLRGNCLANLKFMNNKIGIESTNKKSTKNPFVFISYSHRDHEIKEEIEIHLKSLDNLGIKFEYWCDSKIKIGEDWLKEIESALKKADVAILILSPNFLGSDFIMKKEVPELLKKQQENGTRIMSLIYRKCLFKEYSIGKFQSVNDPDKPLNGLREFEKDLVYYNLAQSVRSFIKEKIDIVD